MDLGIVAVQFDRFDDGQDVGNALAALVKAGEEPIFSSDSKRAHGTFGYIVVDFDTAVVDVRAQLPIATGRIASPQSASVSAATSKA